MSKISKREFRALVVEDFKDKWLSETARDEKTTVEEAEVIYGGNALDDLSERISGKTVTLVEFDYKIGTADCFEKIDDNFVIHKCLYEEVS